jgi:membrane associated rhomboid family serine protease
VRLRVQFLQLYAGSAVVSSLAQTLTDRKSTSLGASGAVNAILAVSVLMNPFGQVLVMGVVPAPAWMVGIAFFMYDLYGATGKVCSPALYAHVRMIVPCAS